MNIVIILKALDESKGCEKLRESSEYNFYKCVMSHFELLQNVINFKQYNETYNTLDAPLLEIYTTTSYCNPIKWLFDAIHNYILSDDDGPVLRSAVAPHVRLNAELIDKYYKHQLSESLFNLIDKSSVDLRKPYVLIESETLLALSGDTPKLRAIEARYPCKQFKTGDIDVIKSIHEFQNIEQFTIDMAKRFPSDLNFHENKINYQSNGGKIIFFPSIETANRENKYVLLKPNDFVFSVCHEGENRSQIMTLALLGAKRQMKCQEDELLVGKPHGATGGYDPYTAYDNLDNEINLPFGFTTTIISDPNDNSEWSHNNFMNIFGKKKELRMGQSTATINNINLNVIETNANSQGNPTKTELSRLSHHRTIQRNNMNELLFNPDVLNSYCGYLGRVIIFAFQKAIPIIMKRLVEANNERTIKQNFDNIYIIALPYGDEIPNSGKKEDIIAQYELDINSYNLLSKETQKLYRDKINSQKHIDTYVQYKSIIMY